MKVIKTSTLFFLFIFIPSLAIAKAKLAATRIYNAEQLAKVKEKKNTAEYAPAIRKLLKEADKELTKRPPSVMDKEMVAISGDKHDYISMGPYWWPDPEKPDGLPYIRKDGQRNPELDKLDRNKLGRMTRIVTLLGLAYYFSDDIKYAEKAADYLSVWFLDKQTRMNPNLNFGQMIPGRNNGKGRGTGLIDTYSFIEMLDAVNLLADSGALSKKEKAGLKDWFTQFVDWMKTSPVAMEEKAAKNNHGLAYDVQLTAYALFIGDEDLAKETINAFPETRLFPQIEADGKQPLELERTIAFSYTVFNLHHMLDMSTLARSLDIDLYHAQSQDGRSITAALNFMKQYTGVPQSEWPYQQIKEWDKKQDEATWMLRRASYFDPDKGYEEYGAKYRTSASDNRLYLLFSLE